jgi:Coenzyme PQQ synthesis protein D (PqqD)
MVATLPGMHLVCNPNVTFQRLGDELVVVNLESDTIYTLNATAAMVWELLQNGSDIEDVRTRLLAEYDVEDKTIDRELGEAFAKLMNFGLIMPESSPEP